MLTPDEYKSIYKQCMLKFIDVSYRQAVKEQYSMEICDPDLVTKLLMYTYALSTWQMDDEGNSEQFNNCLTEEQVRSIKTQLNQMA